MEMANSPAYADDSYHYDSSKTKQQALEILQVKLKAAIKWITSSGLKVNLEKTEMCIFHQMDTSKGAIEVGNVRLESSQKLGCLGILLDNRLTWDRQINKAITDSRKALQAVKLVKNTLTRKRQ